MTLKRTLHLTNPPMSGNDVGALQELLVAKGFPVRVDGLFGAETVGRVLEAKKRLGYAKADLLPVAGPRFWRLLSAHDPFPPPKPAAPRVRYVEQMRFALAHKQNWRYTNPNDPQVRPIPHPPMTATTRVATDCSGGVTLLAECANLPDPNGRRFDGLGYTGTILSHCRVVPRGLLLPGDLVVWTPPGDGHHVAAIMELHADPLLWSHGENGDPRAITLSAETAGQASRGHGVAHYCRFLPD